MNIVVISGCSPAQWCAAHALFTQFPRTRLVRPLWTPSPKRGRRGRPLLRHPLRTAVRIVRGRYLARRMAWRDRRVEEMLSGEIPAPPRADLEIDSWRINAPETIERARGWAPDVVVTAGAPLLGREWTRLGRLGCVNVHFGISPAYRGEHTLFYPWLERRWDQIGVTIHLIDEGVDTGPVLARFYPALDGGEDEAGLWAACARLVARSLPDLLRRLERGECLPRRQESGGRNIRYIDRRVIDDLRARLNPPRPPARGERIEIAPTPLGDAACHP